MMCHDHNFVGITFVHLSFNKVSAFFMFFIETLPAKRIYAITDTMKIAYVSLGLVIHFSAGFLTKE